MICQALHARGNVKRRGCRASKQQQQQERRRRQKRQRRPSLAWECDIIPPFFRFCLRSAESLPTASQSCVSRETSLRYIYIYIYPILRFFSQTLYDETFCSIIFARDNSAYHVTRVSHVITASARARQFYRKQSNARDSKPARLPASAFRAARRLEPRAERRTED